MKKIYRSAAFSTIHETAVGLYEAGLISKGEMEGFDRSCLVSPLPKQKPVEKSVKRGEKPEMV